MVTKNNLTDALTDAHERVIDLEELWDDIQFDEDLDEEESRNHPVHRRLLAARARLESLQQAVSRDARQEPRDYSTPNIEKVG